MTEEGSVRITRLILVPLIITLLITFLRLYGELHHWSSVLFRSSAGGAGAIVGIAWLPFIFGPYFAAKLARAGVRVPSGGKVTLYAVVGLIALAGGSAVAFGAAPGVMNGRAVVGLLLMIAGAMIQFMSWGPLAKTLLAYGFGARLPVMIVMFYAIAGNWQTHYDALPPGYNGPSDLLGKYIAIGLIPQFFFWIPYTMILGALAGGIYMAIKHRGRIVPQPA
jgi:hypothetical protein